MSTLIINLFGAPGAGKSTGAAYVFAKLKMSGIKAELVTEVAKDLTWDENETLLSSQDYVFAAQHHRIRRLIDKVDVVVTDSPLLLSAIYEKPDMFPRSFRDFVCDMFDQYENLNFFVRRVKPYVPVGRNQTEQQSDVIADKILDLLGDDYYEVDGDLNGYEKIFEAVKLYLSYMAAPEEGKHSVLVKPVPVSPAERAAAETAIKYQRIRNVLQEIRRESKGDQ